MRVCVEVIGGGGARNEGRQGMICVHLYNHNLKTCMHVYTCTGTSTNTDTYMTILQPPPSPAPYVPAGHGRLTPLAQ